MQAEILDEVRILDTLESARSLSKKKKPKPPAKRDAAYAHVTDDASNNYTSAANIISVGISQGFKTKIQSMRSPKMTITSTEKQRHRVG